MAADLDAADLDAAWKRAGRVAGLRVWTTRSTTRSVSSVIAAATTVVARLAPIEALSIIVPDSFIEDSNRDISMDVGAARKGSSRPPCEACHTP